MAPLFLVEPEALLFLVEPAARFDLVVPEVQEFVQALLDEVYL